MKEILPSRPPSGLRPAIGPQLPISPGPHMPQPKELGRPNPKQNGPSGPATPPKYQTLPLVRDPPGSSLAPDRPPPNATWGLASWGSGAPTLSPTFAGCHRLLRQLLLLLKINSEIVTFSILSSQLNLEFIPRLQDVEKNIVQLLFKQ